MLHCLLLLAARAVALAGANEDIGVEKGGRDVMSKLDTLSFGCQRPVTTVIRLVGRRPVDLSASSTSPALMLDTSNSFWLSFLHHFQLYLLSCSVIGNLVVRRIP
jgi:hypothetical protein